MVASINPDQSKVTLIGIPRDMVDVPLPDGTTWDRKLNGIYAAQGVDGMRGAISELLQVPIDAYVTIDMGDLTEMVDAVGGVDVNPHAPLVDRHLHLRMEAGPQHIDGEKANGYVRTRFDTDYARAARQQEVLLQVVQRLVDPETEVDIPQLLDSLHSFETDLSLSDMPTFIELAERAKDAQGHGPGVQPRGRLHPRRRRFRRWARLHPDPGHREDAALRTAPPGRLMVLLCGRLGALVESGLPQPPAGGVIGPK